MNGGQDHDSTEFDGQSLGFGTTAGDPQSQPFPLMELAVGDLHDYLTAASRIHEVAIGAGSDAHLTD